MKKIAILQSNYIPWKGYFDLIAAVDEFIIYDDVQYTKNDWRNRNRIKTPQGTQWLTIPIGKNIDRRIRDVTIDNKWKIKHWKSLEANYRRAPYFDEISDWLQPLYIRHKHHSLSQINRHFIESICCYLNIRTKISNSWDYSLAGSKTERLIGLCKQTDATEYLSGPAAKAYIDEELFFDNQVRLTWLQYNNYPEYPQLWGSFDHNVSILDLLFNCGLESPKYMEQVKQ